jgi:hypothetical protein
MEFVAGRAAGSRGLGDHRAPAADLAECVDRFFERTASRSEHETAEGRPPDREIQVISGFR